MYEKWGFLKKFYVYGEKEVMMKQSSFKLFCHLGVAEAQMTLGIFIAMAAGLDC